MLVAGEVNMSLSVKLYSQAICESVIKKLFSLSTRHILLHSTPQWLSTLAEGDIWREFAFSNLSRVISKLCCEKSPRHIFEFSSKPLNSPPPPLPCMFSYSFLLCFLTTLQGHFREVKTFKICHNEILWGVSTAFLGLHPHTFHFGGWNISLKGSTEYFNTL